jgi:hypothetical protein
MDMIRSVAPFACACGLCLAGCAAAIVRPEITDEHFFPAPPDLPRVQFVRSFNGSPDFVEENRFLDYLAGAKPEPRYEIAKPFSVAAWKGRIYVTDSFGPQSLNVFDLEHGRFVVLGKEPGREQLKKPIHVSVDDAGFKFVSDRERRQVVVYGPDDAYARVYGDGVSFVPVSCVARGREVYVLDVMEDRVAPEIAGAGYTKVRRDQILVLDRDTGRPLRRIGGHGSGEEGFSFASFLAIDSRGDLYVADCLNYRIVKLDAAGNVLAAFGRQGDRAGDFAQMKGIAVDPQGLIWVVDAAFQAVQVFDNAGRPLFAFGGPRAPQGAMDLPAGIWIDTHNLEYFRDLYHPDFEPEYLVLVANQLSPRHRVAVYAYGRRKGVEYPGAGEIRTLEAAPRQALWTLAVVPAEASPGGGGSGGR